MNWNEWDPMDPQNQPSEQPQPEAPQPQPEAPQPQPEAPRPQPEAPQPQPEAPQPQPEAPQPQSQPAQGWWNTLPGQEVPEQPVVPTQPAEPLPPSQPYYYPIAPVEQPPKKSKKGLRIFALVLAAVVTAVFTLSAGYFWGRQSQNGSLLPFDGEQQQQESPKENANPGSTSSFDITTGSARGEGYSYTQIVEKVSQSIVNITVYSADGENGSYASGIIMDAKKGYVLTNDHIYSEVPGAKFLITLNNGAEFKADFVSGDSRSDIAILKMQDPKGLTAAEFNTDPLTVGESVLAFGQSYGYADTVSNGIVSAVDRRVSMSSGGYSEKHIQTTAAINPGNSGGALVNMHGQVVGVVSAKIASQEVEGLGFAIPAERALAVVQNLQQNGYVAGRAKLGITYTEMGTVAAEVNQLPTGLYIQEIAEDSDLAGKGFAGGDVITKVNGKAITISAVMLDVIEQSQAGDSISLTIFKSSNGQTETVTVKLMEAESSHSYQAASQKTESLPQKQEEEGNQLPENPFEYYFNPDNW